MLKHFHAPYNLSTIGFAIQEIEILKELGTTHYSVNAETIWKWGDIDPKTGNNFIRRDLIFSSIDQAVEYLNSKIDSLCMILDKRKQQTLQNIEIAKDILEEEKAAAKEAARNHKIYSSKLKNLDIKLDLERRGILWQK